MTKDTQAKPSAGALRAAREILDTDHQLAAHIIDRETGKWLIEWARPSFDAGLSSAMCRGCNSPNEPGGELEGGYGRGYWLLSSKGINHPWHASCASLALGEYENRETGMAELLEAAKEAFDHLEIYRRAVKYSARDMGNAVPYRLGQAIAKCEGKGSE